MARNKPIDLDIFPLGLAHVQFVYFISNVFHISLETHCKNMACEGKWVQPMERFYKVLDNGVPLKRAKKVRKYAEKLDKKMLYPIEASNRFTRHDRS